MLTIIALQLELPDPALDIGTVMKPLEKDELYQNLQGFLKNKGVELNPGGYSQKIQKSCELLSDAINAGQKGLTRAKVEIDKKLDQLRQVIHEKTAPAASAPKPSAETTNPSSGSTQTKKKSERKKANSRRSSKKRNLP